MSIKRADMVVRRIAYKVANRLPSPHDEQFRRLLRRLRDLAERTRPRRAFRKGRHRPDALSPEIESRLDEIEQLLGERRPPEHGKFVFRARLLQAEEELGQMIRDGLVAPRPLVLHARLAVRLGKWRDSEKRWNLLLSSFPGQETRALPEVAQARRKLGDLRGASHALERVPPTSSQSPSVTAERRRLQAELEAVEAGAMMKRYIEGVREGRPSSRGVLRETLTGQRIPPVHLESVADLVERACQVMLSGGATAPPPILDAKSPRPGVPTQAGTIGPPVILTAGFGWSGSSAVKDFLLGSPDVALPFPPPELSLLGRRSHNVPVLDVLTTARKGKPWQPVMLRFLLTSVLGLWFPDATGSRRERMRSKSVLGHVVDDDPAMSALVLACHRLIDRLETDEQGPPPESLLLSHFLDEVVTIRNGSGCHYLLDNAVPGRHASLVSVFSNAYLIASFRDPRDQYVSRMYEQASPDAHRARHPVEDFIRKTRDMYRQFEKAHAHPVHGRRIMRVQFEEMVTDPEVRGSILRRLSLKPPDRRSREKYFDPQRSQQNIGIFKQYPHEKDIAKIEEGLPEYVVDI